MNARIKQLTDGSVLCMSENSDEAWAVLNGFSADIYEVEQGSDEKYYLAGQAPQASLDELKAATRAAIDEARDTALAGPSTLEVEDVGEVLFDTQATINIMALQLRMSDDDTEPYVLADDSSTLVTKTQVAAIANAFYTYGQSIYAAKTTAYTAIDAAETASDLSTITL